MATRCEICGKKPVSGFRVSHSKRHTKRRWRPNVQHATIYIQGMPLRVAACTRCLRTQQKATAHV